MQQGKGSGCHRGADCPMNGVERNECGKQPEMAAADGKAEGFCDSGKTNEARVANSRQPKADGAKAERAAGCKKRDSPAADGDQQASHAKAAGGTGDA